jgi:hypothetical protein
MFHGKTISPLAESAIKWRAGARMLGSRMLGSRMLGSRMLGSSRVETEIRNIE